MSQKNNHAHLAFNRGLISKLGLARIDLERTNLSAEIQENWIPRVLGSAMLRPGLEYIGGSKDNGEALHVPFIFSKNDTSVLEFTDDTLRFRIDDELLTRPSVNTAVSNGSFATDVTGWTDSDESGAFSAYYSGYSGSLGLIGDDTGTLYAMRDQQVTVALNDRDEEHCVRVVVARGPVEVKIGSTQGGQEYFGYSLGIGIHSLSFTPTDTFWIRIQSKQTHTVIVSDINIESAGIVEIETDIPSSDLSKLIYDQSGDILFFAYEDNLPFKIERRTTRSWSYVLYEANEGPFLTENLTKTTVVPDFLQGDVTLTASAPLFKSGHVGALFSITSTVQNVIIDGISAADQFTDPIKVTGVTESRIFNILIEDLVDSTVTLQKSIYDSVSWEDVKDWTADTSEDYDDGLDNQTMYYRIGVKAGDYGTDGCDVNLLIESGFITGTCRITSITNETTANGYVLDPFGTANIPSEIWAEGAWCEENGFPAGVGFHEGRLFWAGSGRLWGSVSDDFYNFNPNYIGDAGPINRTLGKGANKNINWMSSGATLLIGTDTSVKSVKSSILGDVLTSTNCKIVDMPIQGSSKVPAIEVDNQVVYVQSGGTRIYEISYDRQTYNYTSSDLTAIIPEVGEPSIVKLLLQRQPDTRIHAIRSDGTVALLVYDKLEDVKAWIPVSTDGSVEDGLVFPGTIEDDVYYLVNRSIDGSTVRYWEKWTLESENKGGAISKLADSHYVYSGASTATITGLNHLEGEEVVAWGNSKDLGTYTVSSGQITLTEAVTWACVGLYYKADFKTAKPALATPYGTSLLQKKFINSIGVMLADTHTQGLQYGPDFDHLDDLPLCEQGVSVGEDDVWESYDEESFSFPGTWDTDSRVCLRAASPRPCTMLALVIGWRTNEKT